MKTEIKTVAEVRDFWNRRPCNIRHSPLPVGSREYFDEVERRKYFVESHIPSFADFPRWNGKRVLEIGCGIGTDTINFARAGARVTAVDLSSESLTLAEKHAEVMGVADRISFHLGNAEELTEVIPVEPYDLVYSFGVLHHTPDPVCAIAEIKNFLGPDGEFRLMLYHLWSWKVFSIICREGFKFWRLRELVAKNSEAQTGCPVTHVYSKRQVRSLLSDFRIQQIAVEHIFPYRVFAYKEYRYERVWHFKYLPRPIFRALERTIGWHLCIVATL